MPPHNLEAEQAVLGAILAAGRLLVEVAGQVEETDFYRPAHRVVWRAINALADRGEPTDPITVLLGAAGALPAFPVEVLPTWVGQYVTAVATATQTPADLGGMLALAVLATVAAGAGEIQPRPGW